MSQLQDLPYSLLQFYATAAYECSYLPDRQARSQVAAPAHLIDTPLYSQLVHDGFRRSGIYTYRPWCDACRACLPVRLPVAQFKPSRSQRRAWKQHHALEASEVPLNFSEEHFDLYRRYQRARHEGGGMDQDDREQYIHFMLESQVDTRLVEFREAGVLRMVSLIDCLADGLSSVYTFYDPDVPGASYGTYGVLWQIASCLRIGRPYLYLGYWIRDSNKMNYKQNFGPLEGRMGGQWRRLNEDDFRNFG